MVLVWCQSQLEEIANYWSDKMPMMCMEECGELIQAISKEERKHNLETLQNLKEEIRDIFISAAAIMEHYGISEDEMQDMINAKMSQKKNN